MDLISPQDKLTKRFSYRHAIRTDVGLSRSENQDAYGFSRTKKMSLYVVADGMGGARGGATASAIAVNLIIRESIDANGTVTEESLKKAVQRANAGIFQAAQEDSSLQGMGTTVVALALTGGVAIVAHVGDSRIYLCRDGQLQQLTRDHTLVQELVDSGAISYSDAEHHPIGHMLTRSLGPSGNVQVDVHAFPFSIAENDKFLLCCDGLYNLVTDEQILDVLVNNDLDDAARTLVELAIAGGGNDNVTVELVEIQSGDSKNAPTNNLEVGEVEFTVSSNVDYERVRASIANIDFEQRARDASAASEANAEAGSSAGNGTQPQAEGLEEVDGAAAAIDAEAMNSAKRWVIGGVTIVILLAGTLFFWLLSRGVIGGIVPKAEKVRSEDIADEGDSGQGNAADGTQAPVAVAPSAPAAPKMPLIDLSGELERKGIAKVVRSAFEFSVPGVSTAVPADSAAAELPVPANANEILSQKRDLRNQLTTLDLKIKIASAVDAEQLRLLQANLEAELLQLELALAEAQQRLASLVERQRLLSSSQELLAGDGVKVLQLSDDLAKFDSAVKLKKESFEISSLRYSDAVTNWNSDPDNAELAKVMANSAKELKQERLGLEAAVKSAVAEGSVEGEALSKEWNFVASEIQNRKQLLIEQLEMLKNQEVQTPEFQGSEAPTQAPQEPTPVVVEPQVQVQALQQDQSLALAALEAARLQLSDWQELQLRVATAAN